MSKEMSEYRCNVNAVTVWLKELQLSTEVESLNALQAKSVALTPESFEAFMIRESQITVQQIRCNSSKIIDGLDYFIDQIPITENELKLMKTHFLHIMSEMKIILRICGRKVQKHNQFYETLLNSVLRNLHTIHKLIDFFSTKPINNSQLESTLRKLRENFGDLVNQTIKTECKVITEALHKRTGFISLKWSLLGCCCLAQSDAYICRLFIEFNNVIKPLVHLINNYSSVPTVPKEGQQQIKAISLRVLTILCINKEAVKLLIVECIYSQFLTKLIANESSELIIKEATDLTVQLTKPLIDSSHITLAENSFNFPQIVINDFIHCLIKIIKTTENRKIFLLSLAAIANISFRDISSLIQNDILNTILNDLREKITFEDIFIRDQIITILANICRKYPLEIVSSGGLVFILNSLQLKAEDYKNEELLALERILQKVCVAVARLASHPSIAQIFFRLNVIQRLIELCKHPKQRNFSQSVFIAGMAALKRLAKTTDMPTVHSGLPKKLQNQNPIRN